MKKLLAFILIASTFLFFTPVYASSGITFDTSGVATSAAGTATLSYTVGAGAGAVMFIAVSCNSGETSCNFSTAPTYNGVSATEITETDDNNIAYSEVWYINNPTQGSAHNVSLTNSGGAGFKIYVTTYLGSSGLTGSGNNTASSNDLISTVTLNLTTQKNNSWTGSAISNNNGGTSGGTGTTVRQTGTSSGTGGIGDSNGAITPAGSTSMTWNFTNGDYAAVMWEIPPLNQNTFALYQFTDF